MTATEVLIGYYAVVSLVAVTVTVADKRRAKRRRRRVPEATLWLWGAAGGAAAMWVAMRLIRHKTRHAKFMWGLPILALIHAALWVWIR